MKKSSKILLTSVAIIGVIGACGYYGSQYFTTGNYSYDESVGGSSINYEFGDTFTENSIVYSENGSYFQPIIQNTEKYAHTDENSVKITKNEPVSTFSIDVDTASYTNARSYLERGDTPPKDSIRIEEMINYFPYNYPTPETKEKPFAIHTTLTDSPWKKGNQLLHIGIKGFELEEKEKKPMNLVLLIDTSGSMNGRDRIGLLQKGFNLLADQ